MKEKAVLASAITMHVSELYSMAARTYTQDPGGQPLRVGIEFPLRVLGGPCEIHHDFLFS